MAMDGSAIGIISGIMGLGFTGLAGLMIYFDRCRRHDIATERASREAGFARIDTRLGELTGWLFALATNSSATPAGAKPQTPPAATPAPPTAAAAAPAPPAPAAANPAPAAAPAAAAANATGAPAASEPGTSLPAAVEEIPTPPAPGDSPEPLAEAG